jgi:hypothetical protein
VVGNDALVESGEEEKEEDEVERETGMATEIPSVEEANIESPPIS